MSSSCSTEAARIRSYHDPNRAEERRRDASRVATTLGNSRIGAEIRSSGCPYATSWNSPSPATHDSLIRKRLTEIAQLLRVYARLAELAAGERPKAGHVALTKDVGQRVQE